MWCVDSIQTLLHGAPQLLHPIYMYISNPALEEKGSSQESNPGPPADIMTTKLYVHVHVHVAPLPQCMLHMYTHVINPQRMYKGYNSLSVCVTTLAVVC